MEHRYIAVEGPIGVGKTSLVKLLAERLQGRPVLETVEENPFLPAFYKSPAEHAFQTQLFFLLSRYQQQQALTQADLFAQVTVSDYVFAKDRIFATLTLNPDELTLYERVYAALGPRVVQPDLVIYLQASGTSTPGTSRSCRAPTTTTSSTTETPRSSSSTRATSTSSTTRPTWTTSCPSSAKCAKGFTTTCPWPTPAPGSGGAVQPERKPLPEPGRGSPLG